MPRPARVHVEGALCYVSSHAAEGRPLFRDGQDYETYVDLLNEARDRFGFRLFAYALLPNQLHLVLELSGEATISTIMHALNSRYTKSVRKRYGPTPHVFQERFRLTLVEKAPSLLRVTGCLHTLPTRCGAADDDLRYRWSSYPSYLAAEGSSNGPSLRGEVQEVLGVLAQAHPETAYDQYVQSVPAAEWDRLQQALSRHRALGSPSFHERVAQRRATATRAVADPVRHAPPDGPMPMPQPRPSGGSRRALTPALSTSLAIAFVSLCAAGLYARNLETLKDTVRAMAYERMLALHGGQTSDPDTEEPTETRLASYRPEMPLNGTTWAIDLYAIADAADPGRQQDRLEFRGGKINSVFLSGQGFFASRYTVAKQGQDVTVWETVQTDRTGAVVSWRGIIRNQTMHGVITRQVAGAPAVTLNFVGTMTASGESTSEI